MNFFGPVADGCTRALREEGRKLEKRCMAKCKILFWTVLRAQKELDGIRTSKMTATLSSFQKTKNHIKILIFHRRISTKTTFFVSETTMWNPWTTWKIVPKISKISIFDFPARWALQSAYEVHLCQRASPSEQKKVSPAHKNNIASKPGVSFAYHSVQWQRCAGSVPLLATSPL